MRSLNVRATGACAFFDHFWSVQPLLSASKARAKTEGAKRGSGDCSESRITRRCC